MVEMRNHHLPQIVNITQRRLESILNKAQRRMILSSDDIRYLLRLENAEEVNLVFEFARKVRQRCFGDGIFLYGFIYTSTYCRNDCYFCFYRRSNQASTRYRKTKAEILAAAKDLQNSGVNLIDLTMGEDPLIFQNNDAGFNNLVDLVAEVHHTTHLPVMISPGVMTRRQLLILSEAGAVWYACYQETHSRDLFKKLRPQQSYDQRMRSKKEARQQNLLIEEGLLCGAGETINHLAHSLEVMRQQNFDQVRIMTFVPQNGTPMANRPRAKDNREVLLIAIMRIIFPDSLIPASMDVHGVDGLKRRLDAGANVITSIVPPGADLAGVANPSKGIEDGFRTVRAATRILESCNLKKATQSAYVDWVRNRKKLLNQNKPRPIFANLFS